MALSPDTWLKSLSRLRGAVSGAASAPAGDGAASSVITLPATPLSPTQAEPPVAASAPTVSLPVVTPVVTASAGGASPVLGLKANAESWVEVQDSRGQVLLSRSSCAAKAPVSMATCRCA